MEKDMNQYRRSGMRKYYMITASGMVIRVTNKEKFSMVDVSDNSLIREDALDDSETKPVTSEEFNQEFELAMSRIADTLTHVKRCTCKASEKHGTTTVACCNRCGYPTEDFWAKVV
jgi:hypothetical protein